MVPVSGQTATELWQRGSPSGGASVRLLAVRTAPAQRALPLAGAKPDHWNFTTSQGPIPAAPIRVQGADRGYMRPTPWSMGLLEESETGQPAALRGERFRGMVEQGWPASSSYLSRS